MSLRVRLPLTGVLLLAATACSTVAPRFALEPVPAPSAVESPLTIASSPEITRSSAIRHTPAAPQGPNGRDSYLDTGDVLLQVGGSGNNDKDFDLGNGQLNGTVGYMVSDRIEVNVRQTLGFVLRNNADDIWNGATRAGADFYFIDGPIAPYAGVSAGWIYGDTLDEDLVLGPEVGLKWFIKPDAYIDLRGQYVFLMDTGDDFDNAFENGSWFYDLGMGVTF